MQLPYKTNNQVRLTSAYGYRTNPFNVSSMQFHSGLDLVGINDKTICAPVNGVILLANEVRDPYDRTSEWGKYICLSGDDGFVYYLCHLEKWMVTSGVRVIRGEPIAVEGATGKVTGRHLHFEVRNALGECVDPTPYLNIQNQSNTLWEVTEEGVDSTMDNTPNEWAKASVEWAIENNLLYGDENGDLKLRDNATREQMIVFMHRLYEKIKEEI